MPILLGRSEAPTRIIHIISRALSHMESFWRMGISHTWREYLLLIIHIKFLLLSKLVLSLCAYIYAYKFISHDIKS